MADIVVLPAAVNGPAEVGLAAAAGDGSDIHLAIRIYPHAKETIERLPLVEGLSDEGLRMYRIMGLLVHQRGWYMHGGDMDANVVIAGAGAIPPLDDGDWEATDEWANSITEKEVSQAALLLLATKVNMWQVNHHTDQGKLVGFTLKALRLVFDLSGDVAKALVRMVWIAGHWISTFGAWRSFGVTDLVPPAAGAWNRNAWPTPTRDIQIRIAAGPAGSAVAYTHRAIVLHAMRSVYSYLLPPDAAYAALVALPDACLSARYHDGAAHFTGLPKVPVYDVGEGTKEALAAAAANAAAPAGFGPH